MQRYEKTCKFCGKKFFTNRQNQKYCSRVCLKNFYRNRYKSGLKKINRVCPSCGRRFVTTNRFKSFCSVVCRKRFDRIVRPDGRLWHILCEFVNERDGYQCVECGDDTDIMTHHVVPLCFGGKSEYDNLVTLCRKCHEKKHAELIRKLRQRV